MVQRTLSHQWATVTLTTLAKIGKQAPHASEELKLGTLAIAMIRMIACSSHY